MIGEKLPNFLIIGAQKSGTTALYSYLKQHPDIYMPRVKKEPNFFAFDGVAPDYYEPGGRPSPINHLAITSLSAYRALFQDWGGEKMAGEASTQYLYVPRTVERIRARIPDVKLIAILRNPVDRAYSAFLHATRDGREQVCDFREALALEDDRVSRRCGFIFRYKRMGEYHVQLKRYFDCFEAHQLKVLLYDDFVKEPQQTLAEIFGFLSVTPEFAPDVSIRPNQSGVPRNRLVHSIASPQGAARWIWHKTPSTLKPFIPKGGAKRVVTDLLQSNLRKPALAPELRAELVGTFRPEIERLARLLDRDLSIWMR